MSQVEDEIGTFKTHLTQTNIGDADKNAMFQGMDVYYALFLKVVDIDHAITEASQGFMEIHDEIDEHFDLLIASVEKEAETGIASISSLRNTVMIATLVILILAVDFLIVREFLECCFTKKFLIVQFFF